MNSDNTTYIRLKYYPVEATEQYVNSLPPGAIKEFAEILRSVTFTVHNPTPGSWAYKNVDYSHLTDKEAALEYIEDILISHHNLYQVDDLSVLVEDGILEIIEKHCNE